jgi:hypothetical protein
LLRILPFETDPAACGLRTASERRSNSLDCGRCRDRPEHGLFPHLGIAKIAIGYREFDAHVPSIQEAELVALRWLGLLADDSGEIRAH